MRVSQRCAKLVPDRSDALVEQSDQLTNRAAIQGEGDYVFDTARLLAPDFTAEESSESYWARRDETTDSVEAVLMNAIDTHNSDPANSPCIPVTDFDFSFDMHSRIPISKFASVFWYFSFETSAFLLRTTYMEYKGFEQFELDREVAEYAKLEALKRWNLNHPNATLSEASFESWLMTSFEKDIIDNYPDARIPKSTLAATSLVPSVLFLLSVLIRILSFLTITVARAGSRMHRYIDLQSNPFLSTGVCLSFLMFIFSIFT